MTPKKTKARPKIGLTLGGGGVKGYAHIGVYEALRTHEVPIDVLSGASMGAVIAAGIAQGMTPQAILQALQVDPDKKKSLIHIKLGNFKKGGILKGDFEEKALKRLIPEDLQFEDLKIPLRVNAVDIERGEEVVFSTGSVLKAVRASVSLPGIYKPLYYQGKLLVDGGLLNNVPVDHCKEAGAEKIIAVNLASMVSQQDISGMIYHFYLQKELEKSNKLKIRHSWFKETKLAVTFPFQLMTRALSILEGKRTKYKLEKAKPDYILDLMLNEYHLLEIEAYEEIYLDGKRQAEAQIEELKKALKL